jgi:uncharacterized membrane protein (DUF4010 family)
MGIKLSWLWVLGFWALGMNNPILSVIPIDVFKIVLVLFLSFLIGLEREERKISGRLTFGGVRTYPLLGLVGYSLAFLSSHQAHLFTVGLGAIAGLMMLSYWYKIKSATENGVGVTSEVVGLTTYIVGAIVYYNYYWLASTLVVLSLLLLELKSALEGLARRFSAKDIATFTQFLLLTIVILPILPNQSFSQFQINPFRTWLVVVAVSTVSYASFLLQRLVQGKGGLALVAVLGGFYSSTVTTVALAKQSATDRSSTTYVGGILMASGMMYLRLALLIYLFNRALGSILLLPFLGLSIGALLGGWIWMLRGEHKSASTATQQSNRNPLELGTAFLFAFLFLGIVILTNYTLTYLGKSGVLVLATIMGVIDVDPFILGITQSAGNSTSLAIAATAILIATASNNLAKGVYALMFGDRKTGKQSCLFLIALAIAGVLPIFYIWG